MLTAFVFHFGVIYCYSDKRTRKVFMMNEVMKFSERAAFRAWLEKYSTIGGGVWLLFGKKGGPLTLAAAEALEEALCFGWIDGQIQSIDNMTYKKYFSIRRENSRWSEKNKALAQRLEKQGKMTDYGRRKIEEAKKNGQWDAPKSQAITEEQIVFLSTLLKGYEPAYTNFEAMPLSIKKTYTPAYYAAKTEAGREKRLTWMVERLNKNLKPM